VTELAFPLGKGWPFGVGRALLRWALPALLVSQMLAPLWGHWHRIAHSVFAHSAQAAAQNSGSDPALPESLAEAGVQSHRAGDALCQLLDQLSLSSGPMPFASAAQCLPPLGTDPSSANKPWPGTLTWRLFEARAPPLD
jgi:hypothetical protein